MLINCIECGKPVSDKASICPNCGYPMNEKEILKTDDGIILFTPEDLEKIFQCSKTYAYQLSHSRGFPTIQIGRKFYIPKDKLEKWINGNVGKHVRI